MRSATFLLVSAILAIALVAGCRESPRRRPNVILVLVDTLRADRMGLYGAPTNTTPHLDRWARDAIVFDEVTSDAACTFPSVNALFTSRWPHRQLARIDEVGMAIPRDTPTMAEILHQEGFATAAVSSSIVVRRTPSKINHQGGFDAGFERFDESCLEKGAPCVGRQALAALDRLPEPFFLYLHYLEPHSPYRPPRWFDGRSELPEAARRWARTGDLEPVFEKLYGDGEGPEVGPAELEALSRLYDDEIRFFDEQFAAFLGELERRGLLDRSIVVLLADHGEELMDHGHAGHCRDLAYESVLRTPLVIRLPGGRHAGRRDQLVQNMDLLPTILELLGIRRDDLVLDGLSLLPVIEENYGVRHYTSGLQGVARTLRTDRWKLIRDVETGGMQLFDLAADPGEIQDLAQTFPEDAARLSRALEGLLERIDGEEAASTARELEVRLEELGYL